jgi:hypothetical protein
MPKKLPAATLPKLRAALASGKVPAYGEPNDDLVSDIWGDDLPDILQDSWRKPKAPPARRHLSALTEFWGNICGDGLVVGVAINDPGLVPASQEAAAAMKLKTVSRILARVAKCVPDEVLKLKNLDKRLAWYESKKGQAQAAKLEQLEELVNKQDFIDELQVGIFRRLLAEPKEFFEG